MRFDGHIKSNSDINDRKWKAPYDRRHCVSGFINRNEEWIVGPVAKW
jgi:hypothetical protein